MKRMFDLVVALVAFILLLPILAIVALLILITMGGPVFFRQERIGKNDKVIKLYKFRSMSNEVGADGLLLSNEQRVTKLGRFLRKSSIDELPSLINVFKGELSIVGPRPLLVDYLPYYKPEHRMRHSVRPGITGLAQVSGRNAITWQKRLDLDLEYVSRSSFLLDLQICFRTVSKVIFSEGVEGSKDLSIVRLDKDYDYLGSKND